jgi:hypothetical protein
MSSGEEKNSNLPLLSYIKRIPACVNVTTEKDDMHFEGYVYKINIKPDFTKLGLTISTCM